jgi:hypothetical protein
LGQPVSDQGVDQLVGDVAARGHDLLDLLAQRRLVLDVGTEDRAGGDRGMPKRSAIRSA